MALVSPGVEVSIIDQSQYLPTASSSVPLLLVASAQNKVNAAGTGVAAGTTAANANKLYQVTSQRDLVNLFGNPFFYKTTNGTPINGYELNEYGLQAAYSLMSATNRAYVLRADIDMAELVGTLARPTGAPADGTYWLDTTNSKWGIYEFNATTGKFTEKSPLVLTESSDIVSGAPLARLGNVGDYAVIPAVVGDFELSESTYFYKTITGTWAKLGSIEWQKSFPTIKGTRSSVTTLPAGAEMGIKVSPSTEFVVKVPQAPNNTLSGFINAINEMGSSLVYADKLGDQGPFVLYAGSVGSDIKLSISVKNTTDTLLTDLGITAGQFYTPDLFFGTSAQMPLWSASQSKPHPTGSVWIKTSVAGNGIDTILSSYSTTIASWGAVNVSTYKTTLAAIADIDSAGGKNIIEGTVIAQFGTADAMSPTSQLRYLKRTATGPTVAIGSVTGTDISYSAGVDITVQVSVPGSSVVAEYVVTTTGTDASAFVTDWIGAQIPNTTATITTDGAIQLTHTAGGEIWMHDYDLTTGQSGDVLAGIGFVAGQATNVISTEPVVTRNPSANQTSVKRNGATITTATGFTCEVFSVGSAYILNTIADSGIPGTSGYEIGDQITISGTQIGGVNQVNDLVLTVTGVDTNTDRVTSVVYTSGLPRENYFTQVSGWGYLDFISNEGAPATLPLTGRKWYYSTATQADIMVQKNGEWVGYRNTSYDSSGHPSASGVNATDLLGPIMATDAPTTQSDGTDLVYGDLWIDTNDLENYPMIYRWENIEEVDQWVLVDKTDQTSSNGILFADARWATNGDVNPVNDPIPGIASLLTSDYLDLDAPDASLYPQGMLLFNTRRSGYNIKRFVKNYFNSASFPGQSLPAYAYTWVSDSGLKPDGSAYMGRKAQRALVVKALKAAIGTNQTIREEDNFFNLIACPGYPELQPDMIVLNNDRNNTAYIVGDTPLRLTDSATEISAWANNKAGATTSGEDGLVSRDPYLGIYYPSGITTDYTGAQVVVPASHMMLRTFLRNDTVAYPWFAAAGTRRGNIDNATNIGYLDSVTGEFVTVKNRMSIRDVLYTNQINPLAYFTGIGLLNYGNKNSQDTTSALDRTNVARLVAYIRDRVQIAARSFVFEPNDALTRGQLAGVIQSLFIDLVAKRGIYDYYVQCDEVNNTPARIDRNELWVDIAIEPVKAAEFIYIPVRIMNTGEIAATGGV